MKWTDEQLEAQLAGELAPAESARLKADLKSDASLRERLEEAKAVAQMLRASSPEVPSERMWRAIRSQIVAPAPAARSWVSLLIETFTTRPLVGWSVAAAAASLFLVIGVQVAQKGPAPLPESAASAPGPSEPVAEKSLARADKREVAQAPSAAPVKKSAEMKSMAEAEASAPSATGAIAAASAKAPARREPTEVERALNEQQLDGLIAEMLRRQRSSAGGALSAQPTLGAETVGFGASRAPRAAASRSLAGYPAEAPAEDRLDSGALTAPRGGVDANGFWDFRPAAVALNRRDWISAEGELKAAKSRAPEASERAFAASALHLLAGPGQPLEGRVAPVEEETNLVVQSAGRWQAFVDSRVARYGAGVVTRLPGLRAEGSELLLDWSFDRASFSPGTRFTRLSGDSPARVINLQGSELDDNEFSAPRGADYLLRAKELRLK